MLIKESAVKLRCEKQAKRENNFKTGQGQSYFMMNSPLSDLVKHLNEEPGMLPVFDTTGITHNVDLELGRDLVPAFMLNRQLKGYGLALQFSTWRMPFWFFPLKVDNKYSGSHTHTHTQSIPKGINIFPRN